jgi:hypothetical protein
MLQKSLKGAQTADYPDEVWRILRYGLGGNPRKTKRFVNTFYLLRRIMVLPEGDLTAFANPRSDTDGMPITHPLSRDTEDPYLAKLLVIQMAFPGFYDCLVKHPGAWKLLEEKGLTGGSGQRSAAFADFPSLQQYLETPEGVDLRRFMQSTVGLPPPGTWVVDLLLRAVSLVTDRPQMSSGGAAAAQARPS